MSPRLGKAPASSGGSSIRDVSAEDMTYLEFIAEEDLVHMTKNLVIEVDHRQLADVNGCPS